MRGLVDKVKMFESMRCFMKVHAALREYPVMIPALHDQADVGMSRVIFDVIKRIQYVLLITLQKLHEVTILVQ